MRRFVYLIVLLILFLLSGAGNRLALAQDDGVSVPFDIRAEETQIGEGDDAIICVRIVVEWTHHPGTGGHYTAHGWGTVDGGGMGPRSYSLIPADTEVAASPLFPAVTYAQPGNLIYPLYVGQAPADNESLLDDRRNAIEEIYRASTYDWDVKAYGFDLFNTWLQFKPDTVHVGETFQAFVVAQNRYQDDITGIVYDGQPNITSDDDGEASITGGPAPGQIGTLEKYAIDTLRYTLVAEKPGTINWDPSVRGGYERFLPDTLFSTSLCGQYDFAPCMAVIESGMLVNDTGDDADLDPGDGICDADADQDGAQCTLRAVIEETNALEGLDEIGFGIEGEGPFLISPESALPTITDELTLDGSTQPGTDDVPLIRIDGAGAGATVDGLTIDADNVTLRGLIITSFGGNGVHVAGGANGVLEGLIVGSDASGSEGMGNGANGIYVDGGTTLRVGPSEETPGKAASQISFGPIVSVLGNFLNGLYVRDEQGAASVLAAKRGEPTEPALALRLNVTGLTSGVLESLSGPKAIANGANGICLYGVQGAILKNVMVSDAGKNGLEILASRNIFGQALLLGMRRKVLSAQVDIGKISENLIKVAQSIDVTLGSDNPSDPPIQGGGADGWFMDVEESDNVSVRNVLAGLTENMDALSSGMRESLRNRAGGLHLLNSLNALIGMRGVPTVFANNGGDESMPQAGIFASGAGTQLLRALNVHVGTTPSGLTGLGNLGSGFVLDNGVAGAILGGDNEEDQIISGSNGGYGFLFKDLISPPSEASRKAGAINIASATRLMTDFMPKTGGGLITLPNQKGGFCLQRVADVLMNKISIGPSGNHGMEILNSLNVVLGSASIGTPIGHVIKSLLDVQGPVGDGLFVNNSTDVKLGFGPDPGLFGLKMRILMLKAGGRGMRAMQSSRVLLSHMGAGVLPTSALMSPELAGQLGTLLEGAFVDGSEDVDIMNSMFQGNGTSSSDGVGGLMVNLSNKIRVLKSVFGDLSEALEPQRPNAGAAVKSIGSQISLIGNKVLGHVTGAILENSLSVLDGNQFSRQGVSGGLGHAVHQIAGGTLEAVRNTFEDNEGAAFRLSEFQKDVLRFNNLVGNLLGVLVEQGGKGGSGFAGSVVAPDNWWGDPSGPGGVGPGSGDPISEGVEASTWLSGPLGVVVSPESYTVEASSGSSVSVPVDFATAMFVDDVLDVTVTDEMGWVTSDAAVTVPVSGGTGEQQTVTLNVQDDLVNRVTIHAVSRADNSLEGEATVVIVPPGKAQSLGSEVSAGASELDAPGEGTYTVGGEIVINPGGANEETAIISGFGSILVASPLRFDHAAGESIIPADQTALPRERDSGSELPSELSVFMYPNPARSQASLSLDLPAAGDVEADVFDVGGRRILRLNPGRLPAGRHVLPVDVSSLAAGLYLVRTMVGEKETTQSIVVMR